MQFLPEAPVGTLILSKNLWKFKVKNNAGWDKQWERARVELKMAYKHSSFLPYLSLVKQVLQVLEVLQKPADLNGDHNIPKQNGLFPFKGSDPRNYRQWLQSHRHLVVCALPGKVKRCPEGLGRSTSTSMGLPNAKNSSVARSELTFYSHNPPLTIPS